MIKEFPIKRKTATIANKKRLFTVSFLLPKNYIPFFAHIVMPPFARLIHDILLI